LTTIGLFSAVATFLKYVKALMVLVVGKDPFPPFTKTISASEEKPLCLLSAKPAPLPAAVPDT
jgi:hypothetical protein